MTTNNFSSDLCFSHLGIFVSDLEGMAQFYRQALQFTMTDRGHMGDVQLVFLSRNPDVHHQIVLVTGRPSDLSFNPINQISLSVPDLFSLRRFHDRLLKAGANDMQTATHGNSVSIYCRDPEGNRLELFMDTPWYCDQPLRVPIDLSQDDEGVMQQALAIAQAAPKFMPRAQWRAEMAERMKRDQAVDAA